MIIRISKVILHFDLLDYVLHNCYCIMAEVVEFRDFEGSEIWQHLKRSKCGKLSECKNLQENNQM